MPQYEVTVARVGADGLVYLYDLSTTSIRDLEETLEADLPGVFAEPGSYALQIQEVLYGRLDPGAAPRGLVVSVRDGIVSGLDSFRDLYESFIENPERRGRLPRVGGMSADEADEDRGQDA